MRALQYVEFGQLPRVVEVPDPEPGAGQVVVRITAAGVCHTDEMIMSRSPQEYRWKPLPLTLGHEGAGVVAAVGAGVTRVAVGDDVLVHGAWGCGVCRSCSHGQENYCERPGGPRPPGLAVDGAMAEFLLVDDQRHLIPLAGLDPVEAVALTDAGLTSYSAVKAVRDHLGAGSFALAVGVGGLGHLGIQMLRVMTAAEVIAVDVSPDKLDLARHVGAHHAIVADDEAVGRIRDLTGGRGVDVVLDFVGAQPTLDLARRVVATSGEISIVGAGDGVLPSALGTMPHNVGVRRPFWGSRPELIEVVEMARRGQIRAEYEQYPLEEGPAVYERLARGQIRGRAVLVP